MNWFFHAFPPSRALRDSALAASAALVAATLFAPAQTAT